MIRRLPNSLCPILMLFRDGVVFGAGAVAGGAGIVSLLLIFQFVAEAAGK
ncbi:hypothetical protein [Chromobacterium haemolyticum]|nr:hypothetical protein [Chromobacterium haemolyticum]